MPSVVAQRNGTAGEGDSLILTPSKLRLHSCVFGPYITALWLPNAILAALVLFKIGYGARLEWWVVFLPQWIGHGAHLALVLAVLASVDKLVLQQLGPAPPPTASPGMLLQYGTMFTERRCSLLVDNVCSLIEHAAGLVVKVIMCKALTQGVLSSPTFSWRLLLLPCWIAWGLTFCVGLYKPRRERTFGSMRDLQYIALLFVALKLDGLAAYTWSVVFLVPWMWFGALFLGALVTAGVIVVAYACMDLRELALPGGFLLLLLSAGAQLPFFIYLCGWLEGDAAVTLQAMLLPQVASWTAMWLSGLIICWGLHKKEQLRARLAAAGQVWTAHESAARELMSLELEDMQQQVDKMSDEQLAQVAMRMMEGRAAPQQLLRVGTSLYRRALSFTAAATSPKQGVAVLRRIDGDGTAQLSDLERAAAASMEEGRESSGGDVCVSVQLVLPSRQAAAAAATGAAAATDKKAASEAHAEAHEGAAAGDSIAAVWRQLSAAGSSSSAADLTAVHVPDSAGDERTAPAAAAGGASERPALCGQPGAGSAAPGAGAPAPAAGLRSPGASRGPASPCGDPDDGLCTICYDSPSSCVLMECGHGGYCWRCAHVLFARPPSECPVCRAPIVQVVELEDPACKVGRPVRVKALQRQLSKSGSGSGWFR